MKLEDIREIARLRGMPSGKRTKIELIRSIQSGEGNFDCYATATAGICDQGGCLWRDDCFAAAKTKRGE